MTITVTDFAVLASALAAGKTWQEAKARLPGCSDALLESAKTEAHLVAGSITGKLPSPEQLFKVDAMRDEQIHLLGDLLARGATWDQAKAKFLHITDAALEGHRVAAEAYAADHPVPLASEVR